jgi:hypothetical protein
MSLLPDSADREKPGIFLCSMVEVSLSLQAMRNLQNIFLALLFAFQCSLVSAQDPVKNIWMQIDSISSFSSNPEQVTKMSPWTVKTSVGTSFGYSRYYGSSMNMYVAPQINYTLTDRMAFHGGLIAQRSTPLMYGNPEILYNENYSDVSVYIAASYRLSSNLTIHGAGIQSIIGPMDVLNEQNLNFRDLSFGATYNFGSFSLGASFHKADNYFMRYPFGYSNSSFVPPLFW